LLQQAKIFKHEALQSYCDRSTKAAEPQSDRATCRSQHAPAAGRSQATATLQTCARWDEGS